MLDLKMMTVRKKQLLLSFLTFKELGISSVLPIDEDGLVRRYPINLSEECLVACYKYARSENSSIDPAASEIILNW